MNELLGMRFLRLLSESSQEVTNEKNARCLWRICRTNKNSGGWE